MENKGITLYIRENGVVVAQYNFEGQSQYKKFSEQVACVMEAISLKKGLYLLTMDNFGKKYDKAKSFEICYFFKVVDWEEGERIVNKQTGKVHIVIRFDCGYPVVNKEGKIVGDFDKWERISNNAPQERQECSHKGLCCFGCWGHKWKY